MQMIMNLTFYVIVIAFIFALFYLCSRESSDEEEMPSDCELRTPSCNLDMSAETHHQMHQMQQHQQQQMNASLIRAPPDPPGSQTVPNNINPPSYQQVICNEDFYSLSQATKSHPHQPQQQQQQ